MAWLMLIGVLLLISPLVSVVVLAIHWMRLGLELERAKQNVYISKQAAEDVKQAIEELKDRLVNG